jgi:hypothetical protein
MKDSFKRLNQFATGLLPDQRDLEVAGAVLLHVADVSLVPKAEVALHSTTKPELPRSLVEFKADDDLLA